MDAKLQKIITLLEYPTIDVSYDGVNVTLRIRDLGEVLFKVSTPSEEDTFNKALDWVVANSSSIEW